MGHFIILRKLCFKLQPLKLIKLLLNCIVHYFNKQQIANFIDM